MNNLQERGETTNSKPPTLTLEGNFSETKALSKSNTQSHTQTAGEGHLTAPNQGNQDPRESDFQRSQIQTNSHPKANPSSRESKAEVWTSTNHTEAKISSCNQNQLETLKKAKKEKKIPISIQLYFNFIRWAFLLFTCLVMMCAYPIYIVFTDNCKRYREVHGDVSCPVASVKMLFRPQLVDFLDESEFEIEIMRRDQYVSNFFLLVMIVLAILAQVNQKMILARNQKSSKISDFSVILVNLPNEVDKEQVKKLCFEKYKNYKNSKITKNSENGENLILNDLVIEGVMLANYDIGMKSRAQRIKSTQDRIKRLNSRLHSENSSQALKPVKTLLKKYQTLLKIYQDELKALQKSISKQRRRSNKIAIITLKTQKMASDLLKSTRSDFLIVRIIIIVLRSLGCYTDTSPRFIEAVEPGELNWNSIGYSRAARLKSRRKTNCCLLFVLSFLTYYYVVVYVLLRVYCMVNIPDEQQFLSYIVGGYLPTVVSVIITNASSKMVEKFEKKEIYLKKNQYFFKKVSRQVLIQFYSWFLLTFVDGVIIKVYEEQDHMAQVMLYNLMKYTLVKCVLEPFQSVVDFSYFYHIFKARRVLRKLELARNQDKIEGGGGGVNQKGGPKKRSRSVYEFMPSSVISRITSKPELSLEDKYSILITILLMDFNLFELTLFSPFVSIIFMILQYIADRRLLVKRYKISQQAAGVESINAVRLLAIFPKFLVFFICVKYLDGTSSKFNYGSIYRYALDLAFIPFLFLPFDWVAKLVYNRWFSPKGGDGEKEYRDVCHLFGVGYQMKKMVAMSTKK